MLTKTEKSFALLFIFVLLLDLVCSSSGSLSQFRHITKPAILTTLIIYFVVNNKGLSPSTKILTLLALILSLLGDILLLFDDGAPNFFIAGLGSFLLAHIMYAMVFLKKGKPHKGIWLFLSVLVLYGFGLFYMIKDGLAHMLSPVLLYIMAIFTMATAAYARKARVVSISFYFVLIGALLFLLSDSLIAVDKFYKPFQLSNMSIMLTYGFAQLLIVLGILRQGD